ncbi:MAG: hypothetical protein IJE43_05170 [Alphaproteobacteria bacterium]|nr:hypothetical protein [Alphaproteobacteria bacterium]
MEEENINTTPQNEEGIVNPKEKKLIIDSFRHNCSHCGTKSARYTDVSFMRIDIEKGKYLYAMFVKCCVCNKISMHLVKDLQFNDKFLYTATYIEGKFYVDQVLSDGTFHSGYYDILSPQAVNAIDENIIMSIPTPTFIIDSEIPCKLRDLLIEALKCIKENALTGASACIRKAIYQFLTKEKAQGDSYDDKLDSIKKNWPQIEDYLGVLKGIKGITSDQVHEDSFASFNSDEAKLYIAILEEIFREIYVIPEQRKLKKEKIMQKFSEADKAKKEAKETK